MNISEILRLLALLSLPSHFPSLSLDSLSLFYLILSFNPSFCLWLRELLKSYAHPSLIWELSYVHNSPCYILRFTSPASLQCSDLGSINETFWWSLSWKLVDRKGMYPKNIHSENVMAPLSSSQRPWLQSQHPCPQLYSLLWCPGSRKSTGVSTGTILGRNLDVSADCKASSPGSWAYVKTLCAIKYSSINSFSADTNGIWHN